MRIAIPVFNSRVSPVFDVAQRLLVIDAVGGVETARTEENLSGLYLPDRARRLMELGVDVLICGGISMPMANMIHAQGIRIIPYVAGDVEEVLAAFLAGTLALPRFAMPGCRGRRFRFGWGWRRR